MTGALQGLVAAAQGGGGTLLGLLPRGRDRARQERTAFMLYSASVAAARDSWFYQPPPLGLGVADTLDGRFDLISLHAFLLIRQLRRLPEPGPAVAQGVFDAMFSDMDRNLREMGVGDLGVSKRVRSMWEAFHGRAQAYETGLDAAERDGDAGPLAEALGRNVWRGGVMPDGAAARLTQVVRRQAAALAGQDLIQGQITLLPAQAAADDA